MPRVTINKKKYMLSDFSEWVVGRMKSLGITQAEMGQELGISQPAFGKKIMHNQYSLADILTILKRLQATDTEILRLMKM